MTYNTHEKIEDTVMNTCDAKFKLTQDTPLMNGSDISREDGFEGNSPTCAQIMAGTYTFPASRDKHTK